MSLTMEKLTALTLCLVFSTQACTSNEMGEFADSRLIEVSYEFSNMKCELNGQKCPETQQEISHQLGQIVTEEIEIEGEQYSRIVPVQFREQIEFVLDSSGVVYMSFSSEETLFNDKKVIGLNFAQLESLFPTGKVVQSYEDFPFYNYTLGSGSYFVVGGFKFEKECRNLEFDCLRCDDSLASSVRIYLSQIE